MKRLTIGRRLYLSFGALITLTFLAFLFTQITIFNSTGINNKINKEIVPSVNQLRALKLMITQSKMYIDGWVHAGSPNMNNDGPALKKIIFFEYPGLKFRLFRESENWSARNQVNFKKLTNTIDSLFSYHKQIMNEINSIEAYSEPSIMMMAGITIEANGEIGYLTSSTQKQIDFLLFAEEDVANNYSNKMIDSFNVLKNVVYVMAILLLAFGIIISILTVKSIVNPVNHLKAVIQKLGRGVITSEKIEDSGDEIGDMGIAVQNLREGIERTTDFAKEVGSGNFDSYYKPLSNEDILGQTLLKMRSELAENEKLLEFKVLERTEEVVKQKEQIEIQSQQVELLYDQVTDSIHYAKRIQDAILPPQFFIKKLLPNSFIFFKPKDIVSGDFYFIEEKNGKVYFAAVDCTGHGVPGAFMSIVGHNLLKNALAAKESPSPSELLDLLSNGVNETLHQNANNQNKTKDGMDVSICCIDFKTKTLEFAGAYNKLFLIQNGELQEINGDKLSIGLFVANEEEKYKNNVFQLNTGDSVFITTDGLCDQFGGPKNKKMLSYRLKEKLLSIHNLPVLEQRQSIIKMHEDWKGIYEQIDDILVIGLKIE